VAPSRRARGLSRTARQAVGYRELLRHVEEGAPLEECVRDAITQSRRLARRQRSWFSRDPRIEWFDDVPLAAEARVLDVLNWPDGFVRD
jgi:tRNA dimethylallyltransferase